MWLTSYLRTARRTQLVVRAYVVGAVISSLAAVLALFVAFPGHEILAGENQSRAQGLFKDPNVFGPFLIPAALIALEEAVRPRVLGIRRPTAVAVLVVLVIGVVFAFSRAAWLNFALGVSVMLFVLSLRTEAARATWAAVALIAVVGAFAGGAVLLTGSGDFLQERAQVQSYDTERFSAQRTGIQLASEHPLGVGPGQFELDHTVSAHSIYIRVLAEQGVLGLVVIIALLAFTLVLATRNAVAGRDTFGVGSAALLGAWCLSLIHI